MIAASGLTRAAQSGTPIILISIDTLRADHLGIYSYRKIATPHIDSFADHGTVFSHVDSQIPLTLPSHTVLFTSTYPFQNHVEENAEIVPSTLVTLASVLRKHGYQTGAFIGSSLLARRFGLDSGFDTYDSPFNLQSDETLGPYSVRVRRDGALVTRAALNWLASKRGQPAFAFIHLFDLHTPYSAGGLIPNTAGYDTEIKYVDQVIGHFQDALKRSGWWDRSLVILLSDHGESLGDHGETSHGYFIYQSTVHVPLIIHWPGGAGNHSARVDEPLGLIDVAPTILNFLQIAAPSSFAGSNLPSQTYSESVYAHDAFHWAALRRLCAGTLEYIDAPQPELYDLAADPSELHNLASKRPDETRRLREQLTKLRAAHANNKPDAAKDTSPAATAALRSLGYLAGGGGSKKGTAEPDPKQRLPEYQAYEKALTALYSEQPAAAVAGFNRLLAADASNTLARYYLGEAYVKLARPNDAIREWRVAIQHDHNYAPAAIAIGKLYFAQGLLDKASAAFQEAVTLAPYDFEAQFELGRTEERLGHYDEAERHLALACGFLPDSAECQRELSELRRKMK